MKTPYEKVINNAIGLLSEWFDYVDFDPTNRTVNQLAEILACDALQEAGSSISIRWFGEDFQEQRIGGIEQMMFDNIKNDKSMKEFYRNKMESHLLKEGNRFTLQDTNLGQIIKWKV